MAAFPRLWASIWLAIALQVDLCFGAAFTDESATEARLDNRLRGGHPKHHLGSGDTATPLYDDFLYIMNKAANKALDDKKAARAYTDFLHFMKNNEERARILGKHEEHEMPSFEDFRASLMANAAEADKEPVPSYEDFLADLAAGAKQAMHKRLMHMTVRKRASHKAKHRKNPLDAIKDGYKEVQKVVVGEEHEEDHKKLRRELRALRDKKRKMRKAQGPIPDHVKKPLMKRINVLRTQLCWQRPNLMQHEKCLRFLGISCLEASTGQGICTEFTKKMKESCKTEKEKLWREDYCAIAEALDDSYGEDEEKEEEEEKKEESKTDEEDSKSEGEGNEEEEALSDEGKVEEEVVVGSEDDLEDELDEMDKEILEDDTSKGKEHKEDKDDVEKDGKDSNHEETENESEDKKEGRDEGETEGKGEVEKVADEKSGKEGEEESAVDKESREKDSSSGKKGDRDRDGVADDKDPFPDDPNEWLDTDGDGVGDNADKDLDGDGHANEIDAFPKDPKEWKDTDKDGIGDNSDDDIDNDGYANDKDVFPDDPTEWKDSDGDGVGDNKDAYPFNPNCHSESEPCEDVADNAMPKEGSSADPATWLDKSAKRALPPQGYNEAPGGTQKVSHNNYYSWVGDWQDEWPIDDERTQKQVMSRICQENTNTWCKKYLRAAKKGNEGAWW